MEWLCKVNILGYKDNKGNQNLILDSTDHDAAIFQGHIHMLQFNGIDVKLVNAKIGS